tara:strand:- start:562 stop:894 length:333 start_codon:yes stop_codon:yes gene_type:complete
MNRIIILLIFSLTLVGCRHKSFDSDEWKKNKDSQYWMLDDLVESEILIGKNKNQVIELLDTVNIKQYSYSNNYWMFIILKPQPSPAKQSPAEALDLSFENNKIIEVEKRK